MLPWRRIMIYGRLWTAIKWYFPYKDIWTKCDIFAGSGLEPGGHYVHEGTTLLSHQQLRGRIAGEVGIQIITVVIRIVVMIMIRGADDKTIRAGEPWYLGRGFSWTQGFEATLTPTPSSRWWSSWWCRWWFDDEVDDPCDDVANIIPEVTMISYPSL